MSHGSKKWIRDYTGRIKRSTDRTSKDWHGALNQFSPRDSSKTCETCIEMRRPYDEHNARVKAERIRLANDYLAKARRKQEYELFFNDVEGKWERVLKVVTLYDAMTATKHLCSLQYAYLPWKMQECRDCRRLNDLKWQWHKEKVPAKRWTKRGIPAWYKKQKNQEYRTRMKHVMRKARFEEDFYDALERPVKNASYYW